jgi:UDP-N-acetyl-D-mannosaminuronate dehydrogenase
VFLACVFDRWSYFTTEPAHRHEGNTNAVINCSIYEAFGCCRDGYVRLVSGAMFASIGNRVTCVDKDSKVVEALRAGRCPIHEPGLDEILRSAIADGTLCFTPDTVEAVDAADAYV